jgi:hypothetical protein
MVRGQPAVGEKMHRRLAALTSRQAARTGRATYLLITAWRRREMVAAKSGIRGRPADQGVIRTITSRGTVVVVQYVTRFLRGSHVIREL